VKNNFLQHIEREKRQSRNTFIAYCLDLDQFSNYLIENYQLNDISNANYQMIRSWLVNLIESGISSRSVRRKISSLNSFFKYVKRETGTFSNPMQKILAPKTGHSLPVFLSENQLREAITKDTSSISYEPSRNCLIIELFYTTGIRLSELIEIKLKDINTRQKLLKVLGKGNKERIIPLTSNITQIINDFLSKREHFLSNLNVASDYLILSNKGQKSYPKLIYRIVTSHLAKVSTSSKRSPHVLRHSFATALLNKGAGLDTIKEFLGHANLSATQIYTHNSIEKLQTIYKLAHPRA